MESDSAAASCSLGEKGLPAPELDEEPPLSSPAVQVEEADFGSERSSSPHSPHGTGEIGSNNNTPLECFPTDRGNFSENILDANTKRYILNMGPCKPKGPFPIDTNNRCFSVGHYTTTTQAGIKLPRSWLCYSPKLDACYCEPCWLFAKRNAPYYNKVR